MRILITGGGGFLGRYIVPLLASSGHEIIALSRIQRYSNDVNVKWIKMDLAEGLNANLLPAAIDSVVHLAQSPHYKDGVAGEPHVLKVNIVSLVELLRYADASGASRFISASTGSVYEPFLGPMREEDLAIPTGFYGSSKLAAEILSEAFRDRMLVCNLRLFFLFGPNQKGGFIARLIETICAEEPVKLPVSGDGLIFVPTFAKDVALIFKSALEEGWKGVFNVASPHPISVKNFALAIAGSMNKGVKFERTDIPPQKPIIPSVEKLSRVYDMGLFSTIDRALMDYKFKF